MVSSRIVDLPEDDVTDAVLPIPEMMFTYQSSRAINHILNSLEDEEIQTLRMSPFGKIVDITEKPGFSGRFTRSKLWITYSYIVPLPLRRLYECPLLDHVGSLTTRNQLVFESRHQSPLAVVSRAMADAQEWKRAQFTSDPPRTIQKGITFALTPTVRQGTILCNSDAALNQAFESTGLGWIFTPPGSPTLQGSQHQTHVQSALLAEALAIRSALQHAIQLGYTQIWLRSDSLVLVQAITSIAKPKIFHGVLSDIETLSFMFSFFVFSFTPRELNGPAGHLEKATLCNMNSSRA
ncbi:hypothetical protein F2Q69_00046174 [Brassica cretica]|uniref:RNase H type-1 domain-containing protein n=1 Tax=Brassica cretica TaxID=69181 RepID=A0A8S9PXK2_BRACR|nr:hypothetical protein F2Q69_00046174 [Brassica cretica]